MRTVTVLIGILVLTGSVAAAQQSSVAAPTATTAMPGWMAGCWVEKSEKAWTEECWTSARGGVMIGSGRTGAGETVRSWEAMQILAEPGGLAFYAAPRGLNRTRFVARADGQGVTFVNPATDYPQRVRYWREGEALLAEISLAYGSRAKRWTGGS